MSESQKNFPGRHSVDQRDAPFGGHSGPQMSFLALEQEDKCQTALAWSLLHCKEMVQGWDYLNQQGRSSGLAKRRGKAAMEYRSTSITLQLKYNKLHVYKVYNLASFTYYMQELITTIKKTNIYVTPKIFSYPLVIHPSFSPNPRQPRTYFLSHYMILNFLEYYVSGII